MSSARKRAALHKAHGESAQLAQKVAHAETRASILEVATEMITVRYEHVVKLCKQLHEAAAANDQGLWDLTVAALEQIGRDGGYTPEQEPFEVKGDQVVPAAQEPAVA